MATPIALKDNSKKKKKRTQLIVKKKKSEKFEFKIVHTANDEVRNSSAKLAMEVCVLELFFEFFVYQSKV